MKIIQTDKLKQLKSAAPLSAAPDQFADPFAQSPSPSEPPMPQQHESLDVDDMNEPVEDERRFPIYYYVNGEMQQGTVCSTDDLADKVANYIEMMVSGDITELNITTVQAHELQ